MALLPVIDIVKGPPAFIFGKVMVQVPSAEALVLYFFPWKETVTFSPGEAQPHTGMLASRCKTSPLLISLGSFTSAKLLDMEVKNRHATIKIRFIIKCD